MTGKFKPCMDILPLAQKRLWLELKNAKNLGFTLYGGTAIALRLGHRDSIDFDFFSEKPLDRDTIKAAFPFIEQSTTLQDQDNTWVVLQRAEAKDYRDVAAMVNAGDLRTLTDGEKKTLVDAVKVVRDLPNVTLRSKSLSGLSWKDLSVQ